MTAGQTTNTVGFLGPSHKSVPKLCLLSKKKYRTKENSLPEKACRYILRFRLTIWIHRDKGMQMKNEAILVGTTPRDHTISLALLHLFFTFSIYSCSLGTAIVLHVPGDAARTQFFRSAAVCHYTLNDSRTTAWF